MTDPFLSILIWVLFALGTTIVLIQPFFKSK